MTLPRAAAQPCVEVIDSESNPGDHQVLRDRFDQRRAVRAAGLQDAAYRRWQDAQRQTAWGRSHICRLALTEEGVLRASATRYFMSGILDGQAIRVCALGDLSSPVADHDKFARTLVEDAVADAGAQAGAEVALLFCDAPQGWHGELGFHDITPKEVELSFPPTPRPGAPMLSIRAGEDRDLPAIAAMGQVRSAPFRFHLDRDVDFLKHGIVVERLLAGLGASGAQELQFFVTEEGTIATAYVVMQVRGDAWTILQCGDRDPSGARVGAIIQALQAREPAERAPTVRGWLPDGFTPPQATRVSVDRSSTAVMASLLGRHRRTPPLTAEDCLYWKSDRL